MLSEGRQFRVLPHGGIGCVLQGRDALLPSRHHLQVGGGYLQLRRRKLGEHRKTLVSHEPKIKLLPAPHFVMKYGCNIRASFLVLVFAATPSTYRAGNKK